MYIVCALSIISNTGYLQVWFIPKIFFTYLYQWISSSNILILTLYEKSAMSFYHINSRNLFKNLKGKEYFFHFSFHFIVNTVTQIKLGLNSVFPLLQ